MPELPLVQSERPLGGRQELDHGSRRLQRHTAREDGGS
jgi:hypothetical protein